MPAGKEPMYFQLLRYCFWISATNCFPSISLNMQVLLNFASFDWLETKSIQNKREIKFFEVKTKKII